LRKGIAAGVSRLVTAQNYVSVANKEVAEIGERLSSLEREAGVSRSRNRSRREKKERE
jgi:hypothetical protein